MKNFSIPRPCHEDWESMSPQEKGRFCDVCSKCVYDFTKKTNSEIMQILTENENVCGTFKKSQLYANNIFQKWAYQFNEFVNSRNYKSASIIGFASVLLLITGCKKKEVCTTTTGVLVPPNSVIEHDKGNVVGKILIEEDSTQHRLQDLENVKTIK